MHRPRRCFPHPSGSSGHLAHCEGARDRDSVKRLLASNRAPVQPERDRGAEQPTDDHPKSQPLVLDEANAPLDGWDDPVKGRIRWRTLFSKGGTPTDGITCGVADLNPGDWLGPHRHAPPEIYYVFAGRGVVTLNGAEHAVGPGSAVFIPGMAEHGIRQTGTELLRFLYGFPVNSFDTVEYLFSAAASKGRPMTATAPSRRRASTCPRHLLVGGRDILDFGGIRLARAADMRVQNNQRRSDVALTDRLQHLPMLLE